MLINHDTINTYSVAEGPEMSAELRFTRKVYVIVALRHILESIRLDMDRAAHGHTTYTWADFFTMVYTIAEEHQVPYTEDVLGVFDGELGDPNGTTSVLASHARTYVAERIREVSREADFYYKRHVAETGASA